jgi:hypothetical protein
VSSDYEIETCRMPFGPGKRSIAPAVEIRECDVAFDEGMIEMRFFCAEV